MLVILSDLHLTDGTTGETIQSGAFSIFATRLKDLAVAASWRADGSYRPIECIDVVLLGDVLDVIRSGHWASLPGVRPWGNPHAPEFVDQIGRITDGILHHNGPSLSVLRALAAHGGISVPPMFRTGRPDGEESGQPVKVRIHYMVGNRDWFYHLPGPGYDAVRERIAEKMGLCTRPDRPFPHDITESDELLETMRRHKVTARHGDLFDPLSFEGDRDGSSLGDAIVIELIGRFKAEVEGRLAEELPAAVVAGIGEIDNVRPLMLAPAWIDGLLERTCSRPWMRKRVRQVWDRLADDFLALDFVRRKDGPCPANLVDGLEHGLKFSKRSSAGWADSITAWLSQIRGVSSDSYCHHALVEQDFRNRRTKNVVYGHTHAFESVPLDASYAEGFVLNQMYFNVGTWRRVHRPTRLAPAQHEFIAHDAMSYLAVFLADQRSGRPYETWSGTLGFDPAQVTTHRIDPGGVRYAPGQPVSAPDVHRHAPHFATSPAGARSTSSGRL